VAGRNAEGPEGVKSLRLPTAVRATLKRRWDVLTATDMAVIVSLDEKFKGPLEPLRLVFVCAMWLTASTRGGVRCVP
jgi:hypothetical protein